MTQWFLSRFGRAKDPPEAAEETEAASRSTTSSEGDVPPPVPPLASEDVPALPPPAPPAGQIAATSSSSTPYQNGHEHLRDHIERLHTLIQAQIALWQARSGRGEQASERLSREKLNTLLNETATPADHIPQEVEQQIREYRETAAEQAVQIEQRCQLTDPAVSLPLRHLEKTFGLDAVARDILLLCLLPHIDGRYAQLLSDLQQDSRQTVPTVGLIQQILQPELDRPDAVLGYLSPMSPLLASESVSFPEKADQLPLPRRPLILDERITGYLLGQTVSDARLTTVLQDVSASVRLDDLMMPDERRATLAALAAVLPQQLPATMLWVGAYGSGRLAAAQALCNQMDMPLLALDVSSALHSQIAWPRLVGLCLREALLREAAVYWIGCEELIASREQSPHWRQLLKTTANFPGLTIFDSQSDWTPSGQFAHHTFLALDFPLPNYEMRQQLWHKHLDPAVVATYPDLIPLLAATFQLTEGQIEDAIATAESLARRRKPHQPQLTQKDLYEGCRRQSSQKLITLTRRVPPRSAQAEGGDLLRPVLPPAVQKQLDELYGRVRHYHQLYERLGFAERLSLGRGTIALFTGTSGTGKTMAAEWLASQFKTDLYKVDLAAVVSKYVGETEKNLSQIFDQAEDSNAMLFFDEADALFGKRGEVKEARDRWANLEVNYLLQRVEEYAGVVILATNLRQNIDPAFLRRIPIVIEFPFPDAEARLQILQGMFPPDINQPDPKELRQLAERFELTGGSWKNIVIDAAFRALADVEKGAEPTITLTHLVLATAREYQKLGKPITKGEFNYPYYEWIESIIF